MLSAESFFQSSQSIEIILSILHLIIELTIFSFELVLQPLPFLVDSFSFEGEPFVEFIALLSHFFTQFVQFFLQVLFLFLSGEVGKLLLKHFLHDALVIEERFVDLLGRFYDDVQLVIAKKHSISMFELLGLCDEVAVEVGF